MTPARTPLLALVLLLGSGAALAQAPTSGAPAAPTVKAAEPSAKDATPVEKDAAPAEAPAEAKKPAAPSKSAIAFGAYQRELYVTARKLAEPLAKLGDPAAQTLLAEIYTRGLGVRQDAKEAARWYEAAAKAGNPAAEFAYALILLDGKVVEKDANRARELMKAAADAGNPLAQFNYAQMLIQASPAAGFADALPYFRSAAFAGIPDAQYAMAEMLAYGRGVDHIDEPAARQWLRAAASLGHDTAQVELGIWLVNGRGGPADPQEGFLWLRRAAEQGNPIAINRVAHLYKDGVGVTPDKAQAAKWAVLAKRASNTDPELDDFFRGLDEAVQRSALEAANRFDRG
ncbi:tetratricopeptide repeat protein [Consotaella salsifontis]|uniref:TPR repeat n=1 Tax=Consotaella salsifontis TaxID=1365950 RepID=A0A1T4T3J4_9HYPH|nr:tetratricopeptide repeat protein [Consotaella salsifontis]SKA34967.1 hypothetical protein SAMN05428963_11830 [Consotaella salsifontis]